MMTERLQLQFCKFPHIAPVACEATANPHENLNQ